jgi:hypothetical protein
MATPYGVSPPMALPRAVVGKASCVFGRHNWLQREGILVGCGDEPISLRELVQVVRLVDVAYEHGPAIRAVAAGQCVCEGLLLKDGKARDFVP